MSMMMSLMWKRTKTRGRWGVQNSPPEKENKMIDFTLAIMTLENDLKVIEIDLEENRALLECAPRALQYLEKRNALATMITFGVARQANIMKAIKALKVLEQV